MSQDSFSAHAKLHTEETNHAAGSTDCISIVPPQKLGYINLYVDPNNLVFQAQLNHV